MKSKRKFRNRHITIAERVNFRALELNLIAFHKKGCIRFCIPVACETAKEIKEIFNVQFTVLDPYTLY